MIHSNQEQADLTNSLSRTRDNFEGEFTSIHPVGVITSSQISEAHNLEQDGPRSRSKLINQGTLLALLLIGLPVIVICVMRFSQREIKSTPNSQESELKVMEALERLATGRVIKAKGRMGGTSIGNWFQDYEHVVAMFSTDQKMPQVPIDFIQRNPFIVPKTQPDKSGPLPVVSTMNNDEGLQRRQRRRDELNEELTGLYLQTVMMGRVPIAMVNSNLFREGHVMGNFTIKKIRSRSLELEANEQSFVLTME